MPKHDWAKFAISVILAAGSAYLAIRTDLATLNANLDNATLRIDRIEDKVYK